MGQYRARDLVRVPSLVSFVRVPLAIAFPFSLRQPVVALALLGVAGFSDVLDGWYARRFNQVTATGAAVDPITDKLFMFTVAVTLVTQGHLSALDVLLLSTRELGELPLVLWLAASSRARRLQATYPAANVVGKVVTTLQFVAVAVSLFRVPALGWLTAATAAGGLVSSVSYWRRALRNMRAK